MTIIHHFFTALNDWPNELDAPRNQSYILYTQSDLIWMGLLKNMCAVKTMRSMEENFNKSTCIETLRILSGDKFLNEMPHSDTLNYYEVKIVFGEHLVLNFDTEFIENEDENISKQDCEINVAKRMLAWNPVAKDTGQSKRNTYSKLLESFRRQTVTDEDVLYNQRYTTVYLE